LVTWRQECMHFYVIPATWVAECMHFYVIPATWVVGKKEHYHAKTLHTVLTEIVYLGLLVWRFT